MSTVNTQNPTSERRARRARSTSNSSSPRRSSTTRSRSSSPRGRDSGSATPTATSTSTSSAGSSPSRSATRTTSVNAAIIAQIERLVARLVAVPDASDRRARRDARAARAGQAEADVLPRASGTEADETAVMLAQLFTGSTEIVALRHGYSGRSMLAQSLTAHSTWRPLPTQVAGGQARGVAVLLPLPAQAHVPVLRRRLREGHRGADPDDDDRAHRRLPRRADPGRRRLHHAAAGVLRDRGRHHPEVRRRLHLRRGADRLRPHRRQRSGASSTGASSPTS